MRNQVFFLVLMIFFIAGSCNKKEEVRPDHFFMMNESVETGQMTINLTWKVNGEKDDGMLADLSLYLSSSFTLDSIGLDPSLNKTYLSSIDYEGGELIRPSVRNLWDFYRYHLGIAYNGLLTTDHSLSYSLKIDYTLEFVYDNKPSEAKYFYGTLTIDPSEAGMTKIVYPYSMDINNSDRGAEYRSYSFRELEDPVTVIRSSDITNSTTFDASKSLIIEMIWKVNNQLSGYKDMDLDLVLHDSLKAVQETGEMDYYSESGDSYERIFISSSDTLFKEGIPKGLGLYLYEKNSTISPTRIDYMFKVYSYEGKTIKTYVINGSIESPPVTAKEGYYFVADITEIGGEYKFQEYNHLIKW